MRRLLFDGAQILLGLLPLEAPPPPPPPPPPPSTGLPPALPSVEADRRVEAQPQERNEPTLQARRGFTRALLRQARRLVRLGRKLATNSAQCIARCCGDPVVFPAYECCDGSPVVYVDGGLFARCAPTFPGSLYPFKLGNLCYVAASYLPRRRVDVEAEGGTIISSDSVTCIESCLDPICRECPETCCIVKTYLPCDRPPLPGNEVCCSLGNQYNIVYTYRRNEYERRRLLIVSNSPGCDSVIVGPMRETRNVREDRDVNCTHRRCEPLTFGNGQTRRIATLRQFDGLVDGPPNFPCPVAIDNQIGPDNTTDTTEPIPCGDDFASSFYPQIPNVSPPGAANWCNFDIIERLPNTFGEPDKLERRWRRTANRTCVSGGYTEERSEREFVTAGGAEVLVQDNLVSTVVSWVIQVQDTTGCEGDPCDDLGLPPGPGSGGGGPQIPPPPYSPPFDDAPTAGQILEGLAIQAARSGVKGGKCGGCGR